MSSARERLAKMKERSQLRIQQITQELQENSNSHGSESSTFNQTGSSVATSTHNTVGYGRYNKSAPTRILDPPPTPTVQSTSDAATPAAPQRQVLKPIAEQCALTSRSHTDLSPQKDAAVAETHKSPITKKPRSQSSMSERRPPRDPARKEAHTTAIGVTAELPPAGKQKEYVIKSKRYRAFGKVLGTGGSSKVYQALDDEDRIVAIKRVNMKGLDRFVREAYENEIQLLSSLQGSPFVIKLYAYEQKDDYLYVVLEKGEKDLHKFLVEEHKSIDAKFIKYYWQELLKCVNYIHQKKIVHSDLKPANFLFVGAKLKLIDFGIASKIPQDSTSIIKDTQFGTISYMSPEALNGYNQDRFKISEKSDVWSLGCILYAMVYKKTPFQDIPNQMARMKAITSDAYVIQYPPCDDELLLDVMKKCLVRDVKERASVEELLTHDYLCERAASHASGSGIANETIADDKLQEALEELNKHTPRTKLQKFKKLMSGTKVSRP